MTVGTPQLVPTAAPTSAPQATGTLSITFTIPLPGGAGTGASSRAPAYISPNTRSVSFYDGKSLVYVANINLTAKPPTVTTVYSSGNEVRDLSCQMESDGYQAVCTEVLDATCSSHTFDMIAYPNAQTKSRSGVVSGGGIILSEGELGPYTVKKGDNGSHEIILLGVAAIAHFAPITTPYSYSDGTNTYTNVGVVGVGTYTVSAAIDDASGATIVLPGDYDNGPVTFSETDGSKILSFAPASYTTPPASPAPVSFSVQCVNPGVATISALAKTKPDTSYASKLTYTSANYASSPIGSQTFRCVADAASLPVTGQ
ncbi:MAG TPA: hypothetical protein VFB22_02275 [Candidatus Baltobacteraceae bacterium]|nr:hypothetical protein [Candidatus Baltobacteraceae bacterium]